MIPNRVMDLLLRQVASGTGITREQILGDQRNKDVVAARYKFVGECYLLGYSSTEIGRFLARDHSTILHALDKIGLRRRPQGDQSWRETTA